MTARVRVSCAIALGCGRSFLPLVANERILWLETAGSFFVRCIRVRYLNETFHGPLFVEYPVTDFQQGSFASLEFVENHCQFSTGMESCSKSQV